MANAISICSNALTQLGDSPINSFAESSPRARTCSNLWPQVRDKFIRAGGWPCARKQIVLPALADEPAFDWGYAFALPSDWAKTIQVGQRGERTRFEQIGRKLYANAGTLYLVYVATLDDVAQWDASMVDAACAEMVARLAYPITQSASLAKLKRDEADQEWRRARAGAGQDNEPEDWADSPFIDVRG
jgi:hypothetical protein